jgi:23S rRNA pseudouridine2605 synthase
MKSNRRPGRRRSDESNGPRGEGKKSFGPRGGRSDRGERSGPPRSGGRSSGPRSGGSFRDRKGDESRDSGFKRGGFSRGGQGKPFRSKPADGPRFRRDESREGKGDGGFKRGGIARGTGKSFPPRSGGEGGGFRREESRGRGGDGGFKRGGSARGGKPFRSRASEGSSEGDFRRDDSREKRTGFKRDSGDRPFRSRPQGPRSGGFKKPGARAGGFDKRKGDFREKRKDDDQKSFVESRLAKQQETQKHQRHEEKAEDPDGLIRLNKFIANSGVCSRREADELIKNGLVVVNGQIISELGYKVKRSDKVEYDGKRLSAEKPVYILMNKPKGFITTTDDPQERNTVMHIIGSAVKERVYPVGRLDRNTTGLLLITNDGDVADKLTHPSYNAKKIYKVELDKPITKNDLQAILDGVQLEEGRAIVDDLAVVSDDKKTVGIEIHIGWNRVVRRVFEVLGYQVLKLDRVVYAGLDKKDLKRGQWRFLTKDEIVRLKHFK